MAALLWSGHRVNGATMSDPEITPSRTPDDVGVESDVGRTFSDDVTQPAATQIEDETVAIDPASGGTRGPREHDE